MPEPKKLDPNERFNVCQFFEDGSYEYVRRYVPLDEATRAIEHYCNSVAAKLGVVKRVIMTDGGDSIVLEWKHGEGVTFPPLKDAKP